MLWGQLQMAGEVDYDRFWRMPIGEDYGPQIYSSNADLCNVRNCYGYWLLSQLFQTGGRIAGSCTAALFLKAFVDGFGIKDRASPAVHWAHLDIAGAMDVGTCIRFSKSKPTHLNVGS